MHSSQSGWYSESQSGNLGTVLLGDTKITLLKLKQSGDSHYVIFPFTDTGLHISYHRNADPVLQEEKTGRNLASIDMASARKLDEKDMRSLFRYPRHRSDVLVIPIDSLSILKKMAERPLDFPYPFELLFGRRTMYKVRAGTLREFLASNRGPYVMIDPVKQTLLVYDEGFEKMGPMRFGLNRPLGSRRWRKLLSLQYALLNYDAHDAHVKVPEPSYAQLSEWTARLERLFSEIRAFRWNRGGRIRELKPDVLFGREIESSHSSKPSSKAE